MSINIKQRDITDCGAACLASVGEHYKLKLPVSRIRQIAGTDKRGTNVLGMVKAAEQLGFEAKGVKGIAESLPKIPLPAIAHIVRNNLQHYVVIFSVQNKKLTYMDPADGEMHKETIEEFVKVWSGVLILLVPNEEFKTEDTKVSIYKRFWF
jgi:ATP-binding cassette subfamily B protein